AKQVALQAHHHQHPQSIPLDALSAGTSVTTLSSSPLEQATGGQSASMYSLCLNNLSAAAAGSPAPNPLLSSNSSNLASSSAAGRLAVTTPGNSAALEAAAAAAAAVNYNSSLHHSHHHHQPLYATAMTSQSTYPQSGGNLSGASAALGATLPYD